jgi:hypothetical protein
MSFAEDVARAQLMQEQQQDPIDAAVRQLVEQRSQSPDPRSLMGVPDQVAMGEFLPFLKTVANQVNNAATLPSQGLDLGMFHLLSPEGLVSTAAQNAMHPEEGVRKFGEQIDQLDKQIKPGMTNEELTALYQNPLMNAMMPGMLVGPKSALWKSAPQVGVPVEQGWGNLPDAIAEYGKDFFYRDKLMGKKFGNIKPDDTVTIYRGVSLDDPATGINVGDWVSLDKDYAALHGYTAKGDGRVISQKVKAKDLQWAGTDEKEWWYQPPETYPQGAFSNLYDKTPMLEMSDANMKLMVDDLPKRPKLHPGKVNRIYAEDKGGYTEYGGRLGELVDHEELYNAYPKDIENIPIKIQIGPDAPSGGDYNPLWGIRVGGESEKAVKRHIVHEVEHAIQEREGWARGGSPGEMARSYGKYLEGMPRDIPSDQLYDIAKSLREGKNSIENTYEELHALGWPTHKDNLYWLRDNADLVALKEVQNYFSASGPTEAYQRLFGEYMARDTASRSLLDELARRQTMPFSSEPAMTPYKMIYRYK